MTPVFTARLTRATFSLLLVLGHSGMARAQEPPQPQAAETARAGHPFVIEAWHTAWRFEDDGTGVKREMVAVHIRDQGAVAQWGTLAFPYMAATESLALRSLTVIKPDGRRVEVEDAPLEDVTMSGQIDDRS